MPAAVVSAGAGAGAGVGAGVGVGVGAGSSRPGAVVSAMPAARQSKRASARAIAAASPAERAVVVRQPPSPELLTKPARAWKAGLPLPREMEALILLSVVEGREMWKCSGCKQTFNIGPKSVTSLKRHGLNCKATPSFSSAGRTLAKVPSPTASKMPGPPKPAVTAAAPASAAAPAPAAAAGTTVAKQTTVKLTPVKVAAAKMTSPKTASIAHKTPAKVIAAKPARALSIRLRMPRQASMSSVTTGASTSCAVAAVATQTKALTATPPTAQTESTAVSSTTVVASGTTTGPTAATSVQHKSHIRTRASAGAGAGAGAEAGAGTGPGTEAEATQPSIAPVAPPDAPMTSELQWFQPLHKSKTASKTSPRPSILALGRELPGSSKASAGSSSGSSAESTGQTTPMTITSETSSSFPLPAKEDVEMIEADVTIIKSSMASTTQTSFTQVTPNMTVLSEAVQRATTSPAHRHGTVAKIRTAMAALNSQQAKLAEALRPLLDASVATAQHLSQLNTMLAQLEGLPSSSGGSLLITDS